MRKKLLSLNIEIEISEPIELEFWRINLDAEDFYFKLDNECQELIKKFEDEDQVLGVYQYCIGVGELDQVDDLIMKRSRLLNCFTQSFTPFFIQVAKSEFKVNVVTSFTQSMLTIRNIAAESKKRYEVFFDKLHKTPSKEVRSVLCGENLPELVSNS